MQDFYLSPYRSDTVWDRFCSKEGVLRECYSQRPQYDTKLIPLMAEVQGTTCVQTHPLKISRPVVSSCPSRLPVHRFFHLLSAPCSCFDRAWKNHGTTTGRSGAGRGLHCVTHLCALNQRAFRARIHTKPNPWNSPRLTPKKNSSRILTTRVLQRCMGSWSG